MKTQRPIQLNRLFIRVLILCACFLPVSLSYISAQEKSPQRGFQPGNSYALSDIESINTTNGNLMFNFPLGQTAPGRGGLSAAINLQYNSKIYDSKVLELVDNSGQVSPQNILVMNEQTTTGWSYGTNLSYRLDIVSRNNIESITTCRGYDPINDYKSVYIWKVRIIYPDGGAHEFRPVGYSDTPQLADGYFNVSPYDGEIKNIRTTCVASDSCVCNTGTTGYASFPVTYYSTDGTHTKLIHDTTGWTLSFPDGTRIANGGMYDRNNNSLTSTSVTFQGQGRSIETITDQFGRYTELERNYQTREDYIRSFGFNNETLVWTVKWKSIYVNRTYKTTGAGGGIGQGNTSDLSFAGEFIVVDRITLPAQLGNFIYQFNYNAPDYIPGSPPPTTTSVGWGEVSSITLPSGAQSNYQYRWDNSSSPAINTRTVLENSVKQKALTYQAEYDGTSAPVTETWLYQIGRSQSTITEPDGGITTYSYRDTSSFINPGEIYWQEKPNGEVVEYVRQISKFPSSVGYYPEQGNSYIKTEFRSIRDAAGNLALTAIKDYNYDKNGNVTQIKEYDWVSYAEAHPSGAATIPANAPLKRITTNSRPYAE